ncbi:hypothetical protein [Vagococcus acidifermentans]|uniref:Uncharacterized protein n=1 Tax=Vagococcus acidifermentans TaxID=564710 RepID=A0A430AR59_9ENTE|nr:hypothetical protein [Vagococcus acidifermentans]RSU10417.1 hypothetical protein CBF27_10390 [Vagococcus acidifermentans]
MKHLLSTIFNLLRTSAPVSITINLILGFILLIIGVWLFRSQPEKRGGYLACFIFSGLFLAGALSTSVVNYLFFS